MNKLILALFSIIQINCFCQTTKYVGTLGQDITGYGASTSTPYKTITYAVSQVSPGDTIAIMGGTYTNSNHGNGSMWNMDEAATINNIHGTASAYITIKPYSNQTVIFKGDGDFIIKIRNSTYINIEGLEVWGEVSNISLDSAKKYQFIYKDSGGNIQYRVPPGTSDATIATMTFPVISNITNPSLYSTIGLLVQNSNHINVSKCHIHHTPGTGLRAFGSDYINFYKNEVNDCSRRSSVGNHGLVLEQLVSIDNINTEKVIISQNKVHHNYNEVYSWSPNKTFITPIIDEGKGISLQKNTVANGWVHGYIKIENNACYLNGFSGVHINDGTRTKIINNTCYLNSFTGSGNNIGISVSGAVDSIDVYNNIVVSETSWGGFALSATATTNIVFSTNLVQGNLDTDVNSIDVNTIFANPQFTNASLYDFNLLAGSLAINNAYIPVAPLLDYFGNTRDSNPDIGAIEYSITTNVPYENLSNKSVEPYPNPFTNNIYLKNGDKNTVCELLKLNGEIIWRGNQIANQDFSELNNGVYFLRIQQKNNLQTIKLIKLK